MSKRRASLVIGFDKRKGRCVIAGRDFKAGETIERVPVIVLNDGEGSGTLDDYVFRWSNDRPAVALGYGSIYNHGDNPNADIVKYYDAGEMHFVAVRDIKAGEEITYDYGWDRAEIEAMRRVKR